MTERKISAEEAGFALFLQELKDEGVIIDYKHHPKTFELIPSVKCYYHDESARKNKVKEKHLLYNDTYTPDYYIEWNQIYLDKIYTFLSFNQDRTKPYHVNPSLIFFIANEYERSYENPITKHETWIDVKGTFVGRNNLSGSTFPIKQKMLLHIHGIYVQKIEIPTFFITSFTPKDYHIPISRKTGQSKWKRISVKTFMDLLNQNLF